MNVPYGWLLFTLLMCWMFQLWFNSIHIHKFHKHYHSVRKQGIVSAIGMAGQYWKGRSFAILVCDKNGLITVAQYLAGITIFSTPKSIEEMVGWHINDVTEDNKPDSTKISKKIWASFIHASGFIQKNLDKLEEYKE